MSTTKQIWECPQCKRTYDSPIKISQAICMQKHNEKNMKLIKGEMPLVRSGK